MVFPKQSLSSAFQSTKRGWSEQHRESFVWHPEYYSKDSGRNQPRTAGGLLQKKCCYGFMRFYAIMRPGSNECHIRALSAQSIL